MSQFDLIYADADILVVNKAPDLLSVPGRGPDKQDCLIHRVQAVYPDALAVHRLDMATSGLLLMALGPGLPPRDNGSGKLSGKLLRKPR